MERIDEITVGEAMNFDFGCVEAETPIEKIVELMLKNNWGEIIITNPCTKELRIITKERLMKAIERGIPTNLPIYEIATPDIITTTIDESLTVAREIMRKYNIGRLPVLDSFGTVIGMLTARDVCNGFSNKLESLAEHLYSILDNINEAIRVIDCYGTVVFWNHSAEKLFGISAKEIMGKKLEEYFPSDILLDVVKTLKSYHNLLYELQENLYVVSNAVPVKLKEGNIIGAVCTTLDVSKSKFLIEQLEKANQREKYLKKTIAKNRCYKESEMFYTINEDTLKVVEKARKVAKTDANVLIQGESGTGKELLANLIYRNSRRANGPFIAINCSAIPNTLFESEMFGYEGGSFTGGHRTGKKGKFEMANGGTIFLDEIGELDLDMQAKLLRVIQERKFYRVGGTKPIDIDVRLIAATNRNLVQQVKENKFREDLYYRLSVVTLEIPPLRKRLDDLPGLIERFICELSCLYGRQIIGIDPKVIDYFQSYTWPGNVRQLHNLLESIIILMEDNYITMDSLLEVGALDLLRSDNYFLRAITQENDLKENDNLDEFMSMKEREVILEALSACNNNKALVSKRLGIPRSTLYYKMKKLGIQ